MPSELETAKGDLQFVRDAVARLHPGFVRHRLEATLEDIDRELRQRQQQQQQQGLSVPSEVRTQMYRHLPMNNRFLVILNYTINRAYTSLFILLFCCLVATVVNTVVLFILIVIRSISVYVRNRAIRLQSRVYQVVQRLGGGYGDSVPGDVTETAPSGDRTT